MIEHFVGTGGVTFNIDSPIELHSAIDILHTQVMDNTPEYNQKDLLPILEKCMRELEALDYDLCQD